MHIVFKTKKNRWYSKLLDAEAAYRINLLDFKISELPKLVRNNFLFACSIQSNNMHVNLSIDCYIF